jgi:transcriptional regulator with XRE-family HTH domain
MANTSAPHRLDLAIGKRIRERRRRLGMSQQRLGDAIGLTFQQVQKYERGANRISFSRLLETAQALECTLDDLAGGLDAAPPCGDTQRRQALLLMDGAGALLEAYAALPDPAVRRIVLQHVRALAEAVGSRRPQSVDS